MLAALLLSALVVGAITPYSAPPLTRLFFLAPLYAIFAATALEDLRWAWFGGRVGRPALAALACAALLIGSVAGNFFALQRGIRLAFHGFGEGTIAELIRTTRGWPDDTRILFFQGARTGAAFADTWFDAYGMADRLYFFGGPRQRASRGVPDPAEGLPTLISIPPPFVIFSNLDNPVVDRQVREILASRFPGVAWQETDKGEPWSVPYFHVAEP